MRRVIIAIGCICTFVNADSKLDISGFGTVGTVYNESEIYGYRTDIALSEGSFKSDLDFSDTSLLGLQLNYDFFPQITTVFQAVYRNQDKRSLNALTTQAFVKYQPNSAWSYRLGRMPMDLFLLTEYRDVGFALPWAHVPSEVYGLVPYRFFDGADVNYKINLGDHSLRIKTGGGISQTEVSTLSSSDTIKLKNLFGISFEWEAFDWTAQFRYSVAKIKDLNSTHKCITARSFSVTPVSSSNIS